LQGPLSIIQTAIPHGLVNNDIWALWIPEYDTHQSIYQKIG
jgi:hypothetical protein